MELGGLLKGLKEASNSIDSSINELKKDITVNSKDITTINSNIFKINKTVDSLDVNIKKLQESTLLKELEKKVQSIDILLNKVSSKTIELNNSLEVINNNIDSLKKIIENLEIRINTLDKYKSKFKEVDESLIKLDTKINNKTFNLTKEYILKLLHEDGNIDLLYNLKLTPRVLPRVGKEGILLIDAKDNKLKYYTNNNWITI